MFLLTVKQAGTDATYSGIVITGIAVTGMTWWFFIGMLHVLAYEVYIVC